MSTSGQQRKTVDRSLTEREKKILSLTVYFYIAGGEPVGSRFLSKKLDLDISPATVRNIMADLEERGLLRQTHPSSGRIPTDAGFRCYVDLLMRPQRPQPKAIRHIRDRLLSGNITFDEVFQSTSRTLSTMCRQLGIVVSPKFSGERCQQLHFVRIGSRRILAVVVAESGLIQNKLLQMPEDWSQEELTTMSEIWNQRFASRPVREVRAELLDHLAADKAEFDRILESALELGRKALLDAESEENIYLEGASNLLSWPEFVSPGKLRSLMRAIEEKSRLFQLLDRSMKSEGIQIYIGEETSLPEMKDMSLITSPYRREGNVVGVLGVIGPIRMEYSRVIPIVEYTADSLSRYLSRG